MLGLIELKVCSDCKILDCIGECSGFGGRCGDRRFIGSNRSAETQKCIYLRVIHHTHLGK